MTGQQAALSQQKAAPLHVIGLGPGDPSLLTPDALAVLESAAVVVGYSGYIGLISPALLAGKQVISTGMTGEISRANAAVDSALAGLSTVVVCSGDPGVYALAGLVLEIVEQRSLSPSDFPLIISPGVPAVCAAAALLGAPLMHDFACVSLSDLLTPWPLILKRLECAFLGDFVTALYNPRSKRRAGRLEEALALAKKHGKAACPMGVVQNAFRPGQKVGVSLLGDYDPAEADMFTLLIIGNSSSRIVPGRGNTPLAWENGARMLTPRGYMEKYSK